MIVVRIELFNEEIQKIDVTGHGGDAAGKDIVCAAVSAVTQTALTGLLHYGAQCIDWKIEKGNLSIAVKKGCSDKNLRSTLRVILTTMSMGIKKIADEHPDKVKINLIQRYDI